MEKTAIQLLLEQYLEQTLTETNAARLQALLNDPAQQQEVLEALTNMVAATNADASMVPADWYNMPRQIVAIDKPAVPVRRMNTRWLAAASIIILLGVAVFWWQLNSGNKQLPQNKTAATISNDVVPGHTGAVLTLADGRTLVLDSITNDTLSTQNGAQVVMKNGQLQYQPTGTAASQTTYNTMTTPRGRQFNVQLPDGTQVWLNAASSITYPTAFTGNERNVSITGEVYFEVAKDKTKPFKVQVGNATVEVLGTHFNINAYDDEANIKTTLLEGKVRVVNGQWSMANGTAILKPGEQAVIAGNSPLTIHHSPNLEQVISWKNGLFNFENATLEQVMRQLQRWYNIEVVYTGKIKEIQFFGEINKNVPLSVVLDALQNAGVHFRIETGNKLVVMP